MSIFASAGIFSGYATGGGGGTDSFLGYFATELALTTAHPTASAGDYAIVGATDTVWIWDTDTSAWVDSGDAPPALGVKDSGVVVDAATNELNFTGDVSATQTAAGKVDIDVTFPVVPNTEAAVASNFLTSYDDTTGNFTKAQPTVDDISFVTRTVTATDDIETTDNVVYVNHTVPITLTLLTAICTDKNQITIKDISGNANTNFIKIVGEGGELINSYTEAYINGNYSSITLISNGTKWLSI